MLYKLFDYEVKAADEEKLTVNHFISTEKRDLIGDRMHVKGMRTPGIPVVLLDHGKGFMGTEPIAKPLWIRPGSYKKFKGIEAFTQFFDDAQGIGKRLWQKTVEKYMPNWSIGYGIIEAKPFKDKGFDITEWNLFEYSLLGVGMNPDANTIKAMDNEKGLPGLMVKYVPESFLTKAIADQGMLTKGSFDGDNNFYTESIENAIDEMNGAIDEFEKNKGKENYSMNDVNDIESKSAYWKKFESDMNDIKEANKIETEQSESMVKSIDELNEKIDRLETTVNNMVDVVDGKFKEYAGIVKDLKIEKKERKIVFKMPKQQTKEAPKEGITKAHIDTIISAMNEKYLKEFRKTIGKVD